GPQGPVALNPAPARQSNQNRQIQSPQSVHAPCPPHHLLLRLGPLALLRQQSDVGPLQHRGQASILGLGRPQRGAIGQTQPGSSTTGLPLLAGQPVAQRVNQVVVGELIAPLGSGSDG